jgi:hypothetical protein
VSVFERTHLSVAENRNRETMPSNWWGAGLLMWERSGSADFEHVAELSLASWCLLTTLLRRQALPLADEGKGGAVACET